MVGKAGNCYITDHIMDFSGLSLTFYVGRDIQKIARYLSGGSEVNMLAFYQSSLAGICCVSILSVVQILFFFVFVYGNDSMIMSFKHVHVPQNMRRESPAPGP